VTSKNRARRPRPSAGPSGRGPHEPDPDRLPLDEPFRDEMLARHRRAVDAGEDGYEDPETGFHVFTSAYLVHRGFCCNTGCRHCPYV
jgi:hypothetical protein